MSAAEGDVPDLDDFTLYGNNPLDCEPFRINDDNAAGWAMRKLRRAEAEQTRLTHAANAEKHRVDAWLSEAMAGPRRDARFFEDALVDYFRRLEADDPDIGQTYKIPGGAISRRKDPDKVEVIDAEAFVTWALDNEPAALAPPKPLVSVLKGHRYTDTDGPVSTVDGEVVPGVRRVVGVDRYSVKPVTPEQVRDDIKNGPRRTEGTT